MNNPTIVGYSINIMVGYSIKNPMIINNPTNDPINSPLYSHSYDVHRQDQIVRFGGLTDAHLPWPEKMHDDTHSLERHGPNVSASKRSFVVDLVTFWICCGVFYG